MSGFKQKRYLLVKHSEGWNVDRCCRWMDRTGQAFEWCYPASGQAFPDPNEYQGVIVFGGACSANDCRELDWIKDELKFIEACLKTNTPYFGICLGAQMLARVLGATISKRADGQKEIGFFKVHPTPAAGQFLTQPLDVLQWHNEGFDIPAGCVNLAYSDLFPNQAFSLSPDVLGVQFHPEVNLDVLRIWHERNSTRPIEQRLAAEVKAQQITDAVCYEQAVTDWFEARLSQWTQSRFQVA